MFTSNKHASRKYENLVSTTNRRFLGALGHRVRSGFHPEPMGKTWPYPHRRQCEPWNGWSHGGPAGSSRWGSLGDRNKTR